MKKYFQVVRFVMNIYHRQIRLRTFHQINFFWYLLVDHHHRHSNLIHFLIYLIQLALLLAVYLYLKIKNNNNNIWSWFIWAVFLKRVPSSESSSDMFWDLSMFEVDDRLSACPEALSRTQLLITFSVKVEYVLVSADFYGFRVLDII